MTLKNVLRWYMPLAVKQNRIRPIIISNFMNSKEQIIQQIEYIPEPLLNEVLNFIQFLKYKHLSQEKLKPALLSESSLQKDWLTPEDDEAWKHL